VKAYTTLQIWEAAGRLIKRAAAESETPEDREGTTWIIEYVVNDLIQELTGPPTDITPSEIILIPQFGFAPVVGEINADPQLGNRVKWNREE